MSLRTKYLLINLLFAVVITIAFAGALVVVGIHYTRLTAPAQSVSNLNAVQQALSHAADNRSPQAIKAAEAEIKPKGFGLLWLDEGGNLLYDGGANLDKREQAVILATAQEGKVTSAYGVLVLQRGMDEGKLIAYDDAGYKLPVLARDLIIMISSLSGLLILSAVLNALIQNSFVMPRVRKARDGLQQLYRGNYDVALPTTGKKRDDVALLLVDIEAVRRKLSDLAKQREAFDREQGVMISGISHDMRTPLTVIKTHAKGLIDGVAQKRGKAGEYYERIYQTADDMTGLVERLSSFGKGQNREVMYSFADRDMVEVLKDFVKTNYYPYAARGLEIKANLPLDDRVWVSLDKEQALRVWQNICDNALKYKTAKTGHLLITLTAKGDWATVTMADDGPGIQNFEADYIFESYYRGDPSRTNPISGSGLGLAVVKSIVGAHHGEVRAYNDHGLTIEIKLPLRRKK